MSGWSPVAPMDAHHLPSRSSRVARSPPRLWTRIIAPSNLFAIGHDGMPSSSGSRLGSCIPAARRTAAEMDPV